jgi:hypothetical protein
MDGYPTGHGQELVDFFDGLTLVNGLGIGDNSKTANGMGCLAAQLVAHFKEGAGGIYIEPSNRAADEDYPYFIEGDTFNTDVPLKFTVKNWGKKVFEGDFEAFKQFCAKEN